MLQATDSKGHNVPSLPRPDGSSSGPYWKWQEHGDKTLVQVLRHRLRKHFNRWPGYLEGNPIELGSYFFVPRFFFSFNFFVSSVHLSSHLINCIVLINFANQSFRGVFKKLTKKSLTCDFFLNSNFCLLFQTNSERNSERMTGFEPTTFRTLGGRSIH